jgi:hypothetical protein
MPDGSKNVWWTLPDDTPGLKGIHTADLPLYGAHLLPKIRLDEEVVVCEGEKACSALWNAGVHAVATVTGASGTPSREALSVLAGRRVILWPDSDGPGEKHMDRIGKALLKIGAERVRWFTDASLPDKGDAADYPPVQAAPTDPSAKEMLIRILAEAPEEYEAPDHETISSRTFTGKDLMAEEMPPVRWAVPGILPEGVTLFGGKPKMGKSWMALGLCIAVATGGVALGKERAEQGEVLYLALEDNKRRLRRRMEKLLVGGVAPEGLHLATEWERADAGGIEMLREFLSEHPECRLVVLDTLARFKPGGAFGKRSQYDEDRTAVDPLIPIAAEHNVAIVLVHHLREAESDDPLDMMHGSAGLTGVVDGALVLKRQRGQADAYLHIDGRDIAEPAELALRFDTEAATWTIVGDADEYRLSKGRTAIQRLLEDADEPLAPKEITACLNEKGIEIKNGAVREMLSQMVKAGQVKNLSRGQYVHPDYGISPDDADILTNGSGDVRTSGLSGNFEDGDGSGWQAHEPR